MSYSEVWVLMCFYIPVSAFLSGVWSTVKHVFVTLLGCRRSWLGYTHGPHTIVQGLSFHAQAHKTGTLMFRSMHLGLHATGDSMLCPLTLLGLGMPTAESPAMMAVISEWSSCLICNFGSVCILQNCFKGGCIWIYTFLPWNNFRYPYTVSKIHFRF